MRKSFLRKSCDIFPCSAFTSAVSPRGREQLFFFRTQSIMPTRNTRNNGWRQLPSSDRRFSSASIRFALTSAAALGAAVVVFGCSKGEPAASNSAPAAGKISVASAQTGADTDHAAAGTGLPAGYSAVFDHADAKSSDVSYVEKGPGKWEVKTGPAHVLYSPGDTAANKFIVSATFEQLEAPAHPEAFGVFIGGSNLSGPTVKYTYFIVRGDGMYMVKVRDGANTRTITNWTASPAIPKQDAKGKGLYGIRVDVRDKVASVSVNGAPVTTIAGKDAPLNGITGVRINHNLHLIVTPVTVVR